jgi:hypothetical protein
MYVACCSVVVKALCYKVEGRGFETWWGEFFSIYLILLAALGPVVHLASNINEFQKQRGKGQPVRKGDKLTLICEQIV